MDGGNVEDWIEEGDACVGVAMTWQSPIYSSMRMTGILASVGMKEALALRTMQRWRDRSVAFQWP